MFVGGLRPSNIYGHINTEPPFDSAHARCHYSTAPLGDQAAGINPDTKPISTCPILINAKRLARSPRIEYSHGQMIGHTDCPVYIQLFDVIVAWSAHTVQPREVLRAPVGTPCGREVGKQFFSFCFGAPNRKQQVSIFKSLVSLNHGSKL